MDHSGVYGIPYDHKIGEEGAKEEEAETLVRSEADTDRKGKNMHRSASEEGGPKSIVSKNANNT